MFSYEPEFAFDVKHQFYKYYPSNSGNKVFEDNLQVLVFVEIDDIFLRIFDSMILLIINVMSLVIY